MRFKNCFRVESVKPEGIFLLSERSSCSLSDPLFQLLTPLIDNHHTVEEIQTHLLEEITSSKDDYFLTLAKANYALMEMEQKGYIVESNDILPSDLTIFCEHLNIDPKEAHRRLQATKVAVKTFGSNLPISQFKAALESLHVQVSEEADIEVVLTDDYLQDGLDAFNQEALHLSRPWMLVKPVGTIVWIGPIFVPGKTGCWQCLAQRLRGNRPVEGFIQQRKNILTPLTPPLAFLSSTLHAALGMAATEVFKWIVQRENKQLEGIIVTHDTLCLENQKHILVKRFQCHECGQKVVHGLNSQPLPIILGHRKKTFITEEGHRCVSPEETLQKYQHHISPITGVIRELVRVTKGSNGLTHTYLARHHFATMFDDLNALHQNTGGRSVGIGRTDQQARVSSFCKAIERYSGVFQGDEIRQRGSYQKMGDKAIHPNACMNFSQEQYRNRPEWNASCSGIDGWFQQVPEPFDEEREIDWTPVWSLTHQEFKYLPTAYCYFGYPKPAKPDCWADANGCAAGNTIEEAIVQGFMELVERDCAALWWYNQVKRPRVDSYSFNEPYFQVLKHYYQTIHRELWVLDITSDLKIPTFAAISRRTDREVEDIIFGFGAHFDPKIAIQKSLTEATRMLLSVLSANPDGTTQYAPLSDRAINWWKAATLENQRYLVPDTSIAPKIYADYPQIWSDDLREDVITCQQIAEKNGMEMLVLDQTRPDIGLKVVKAIVPGMRHFWKRLSPGRLYEVPVKLGWLKEPLKENQLNPFLIWM